MKNLPVHIMELVSPNFSDLLKPNIEIKKFPDGDSYVRIPDIKKCSSAEVVLYHRLYPNQNNAIVELLLIVDILKSSNASVTVASPYLPYSRQDKILLDGEGKSAETLCRLFAMHGINKLITLDCHFIKKQGMFQYGGLSIINVSMNKALIAHAKNKFGKEPFLIISPDAGASYLVENFGGRSMKKTRGGYRQDSENIERTVSSIESTIDVKNKNILLIDDMIAGGGTMIKAVENLKRNGAAKIGCAATHGFFLGDSLKKLKESCEFVFSSNSIKNPAGNVDIMPVIKSALQS